MLLLYPCPNSVHTSHASPICNMPNNLQGLCYISFKSSCDQCVCLTIRLSEATQLPFIHRSLSGVKADCPA